jgi:hypothetical protein
MAWLMRRNANALIIRMTIEELEAVNATLLWINLKSGLLPACIEAKSANESCRRLQALRALPGVSNSQTSGIRSRLVHTKWRICCRFWGEGSWKKRQLGSVPRLRVVASAMGAGFEPFKHQEK